MEYKAELKAYEVNTMSVDWECESVQRGYLEHKYGKNEHEARKKLLSMCFNNGVETDYNGEQLTYIKLRTKRRPELDKYLVDGKLKTLSEIKHDNDILENKNKLNKILEDNPNPNAYAYIRKGGYFYCSNFCGYTEYKENAGVYTIKQAVQECLSMDLRDYMRPEIIDIESHNKMIDDKISALTAKKIPAI